MLYTNGRRWTHKSFVQPGSIADGTKFILRVIAPISDLELISSHVVPPCISLRDDISVSGDMFFRSLVCKLNLYMINIAEYTIIDLSYQIGALLRSPPIALQHSQSFIKATPYCEGRGITK